MIEIDEINGDLIELAKVGYFDVIAHGCNCFCTQKSGIAKSMSETFNTHKFVMENSNLKGNISKLGCIDYELRNVNSLKFQPSPTMGGKGDFYVVNAYTQYNYGTDKPYIDYHAFALCMQKINHTFKGKHIGIPKIGTGLAGGNWYILRQIVESRLIDCKVTVVNYEK